MPRSTRSVLAIGALTALRLLIVALALLVSSLSYSEPFGYGANGISLMICVPVIGILAVVLVAFLLACYRAKSSQSC